MQRVPDNVLSDIFRLSEISTWAANLVCKRWYALSPVIPCAELSLEERTDPEDDDVILDRWFERHANTSIDTVICQHESILFRVAALKHVNFMVWDGDPDSNVLASCRNISQLVITMVFDYIHSPIVPPVTLVNLARMQHLCELTINPMRPVATLSPLAALPNLASLSVEMEESECFPDQACILDWQSISTLHNISYLTLSVPDLPSSLSFLEGLTNLERVSLHHADGGDVLDEFTLHDITDIPCSLKHLQLSQCTFGNATITSAHCMEVLEIVRGFDEDLVHIPNFTRLHTLILRNLAMALEEMKPLCRSHTVTNLTLSCISWHDSPLQLCLPPKLQRLDVLRLTVIDPSHGVNSFTLPHTLKVLRVSLQSFAILSAMCSMKIGHSLDVMEFVQDYRYMCIADLIENKLVKHMTFHGLTIA